MISEGQGGDSPFGAGGEQGSYHIRLEGDKIIGPLKLPMIRQMVRARRLTGNEAVSEDRKTWLAILSVPVIAEMFGPAEETDLPAAAAPSAPPARSTMMFSSPAGPGPITDQGSGLFGEMDSLPGRVDPQQSGAGKIGEGLTGTTGFDLPSPVAPDLPGRIDAGFGDLPGRADDGFGDLPGRADDGFGDLPGRADDGLGGLPGRADAGFGDLPGRQSTVMLGAGVEADSDITELELTDIEELDPAQAGTSGYDLDALDVGGAADPAAANMDDFWGAPGAGAVMEPGAEGDLFAPEESGDLFFEAGDAAGPNRPISSATVSLDAFDGPNPFSTGSTDSLEEITAAAATSAQGEFGSFFDGAAADGAAPAQPQAAPAQGGAAATARQAAAKRKSQRLLFAAGAVLVIVLLALVAVVGNLLLKPDEVEEEAPVVVAPVEPQRQVIAHDREDLEERLRRANFNDLNTMVTAARQGGSASPEQRSQWLHALALATYLYPELGDQRGQLDRLFDELRDAQATEIVQLARGAYLAAVGDEGAVPVLALLEESDSSAWARVFTGVYYLQVAAGVIDEADEDPLAPDVALERASEVLAQAAADDSSWALPAFLQAAAALAEANFDLARQAVEEALARDSGHVGALLLAAQLDKRTGRITEAEAGIERLVNEFEEDASPRQRASALALKGELEFARFRLEEAIESFSSALRVDSTDVQLVRRLSEVYGLAGRDAQALEYFESTAAHGMERIEVAAAVGYAMVAIDRLEDAQAHAERLKGDFPSDGRFPYILGMIAEERTQFALARELYAEALRVDPEFIDPELRLVELDRLGGNRGGAMERLDRMSRTVELDSRLALRIADAYSRLNEMTPAIRHYIRSIELDQANSLAWLNLIEYYLDGGQYQRAMARIQELIDVGSAHPRLSYNRARALLGLGNYTSAIEEMIGLLEGEPNNVDYLLLSGRIHLAAGNYRAAVDRLDQARESSSFHPDVLLLKAQAEFQLGNYQESISVLTTLSARRDDGEVRYWMAQALEAVGQAAAAVDEYTRSIEQDSGWALEHPEVFEDRGNIYLNRGSRAPAMNDLKLAVTLRPQEARANALFAAALYENSEYRTAIRYFERALDRGWEDPSALYFTGVSYLSAQPSNPRVAYDYLVRAEDAGYASTREELYRRLGYVARELGQTQDAVSWFRKYLERGELSADLRREIENEIRRMGASPR